MSSERYIAVNTKPTVEVMRK